MSKRKPDPRIDAYISPEELVEKALSSGDEGLCASFNEPTVGYDYLVDVFSIGREKGLYATIVTNGYFTIKALKTLLEIGVDGYSIDVKGCPYTYRRFTGVYNGAEIVLRNAKYIIDNGGHVELVLLIVPSANDNEECVNWMLGRIHDTLGVDVPLHVNQYYPAYKYRKPAAPVQKLIEIHDKAKKMGLNYVYIGNIGFGTPYENTYCPRCGKILIRRHGTEIIEWNLTSDNRCPRCGYKINIRGKRIVKPEAYRWKTIK